MKGKTLSSIALALLIAISAIAVLPARSQETTAQMYFEGSPFNGTLDVGDTFWTAVMIKDFTDLYGWQVEITWPVDILELAEVKSPPFITDDIFDVLAPGTPTFWAKGAIDNDHGIFTYSGYNLLGVPEGVTGLPGVGYKMMDLKFKVRGLSLSAQPIHWNKPWPEYPMPTCMTFWLNHLLAAQPCIYTDGTVQTIAPKPPSPPQAKFIWYPMIPKIEETVTFNAGDSKPGWNGTHACPIEEYRWDFDGDGVYEHNVTTAVTTHVFIEPRTYLVTLEVYAPGTTVEETNSITKSVTVIPPPMGAVIDIYCQKAPFDGTGPNVRCDAFAPQELMILYAKVTYNDDPVKDKIVGFEVRDALDNCVLYRTAITDAAGIAVIEFRIASMPAFGDWIAIGIVDVAQTTVADTMPFSVGWIVKILSVKSDRAIYNKLPGVEMFFEIEVRNIALTTRHVTLTVVVYDACGVPIGQLVVPCFTLEGGFEGPYATTLGIPIPPWTFVSPPPATAYVNLFTDLPSNNGVPTCPEQSCDFLISKP